MLKKWVQNTKRRLSKGFQDIGTFHTMKLQYYSKKRALINDLIKTYIKDNYYLKANAN